MSRTLILALPLFAIAGCGSPEPDEDGDGKISFEEAAAVNADEYIKPEPGQYRATVEFVNVDMPGAPAQIREQMEAMLDQGAQTSEYCLTPEEAEKGFEEVIREAQVQDECSFESFEIDSGTIDAVMVCEQPGQGSIRMAIEGQGGRTSSKTQMTMAMTAPGGQEMSIVTRSEQERIGDCAS